MTVNSDPWQCIPTCIVHWITYLPSSTYQALESHLINPHRIVSNLKCQYLYV